MSIFTKNDENLSSNDFSKAWASATQRVKDAAAALREQQKTQQAQQAVPKPSKTYTVTTTKGKQYTLDDDAYNWISNRYFRDNADSYGLDDADQYARRTGQMSASMRKSYKNSTVDQKLAEMGLPSEKNLEKYLGEYNKWHTGGMDQLYGNAVSSEQWAKMGEMYKRDWAYDNTVEDQTRKALGLVPTKLLAEYADTELDESLMARGLPPSASLLKYNDQYNNYKGIDTLYKNAAGAITSLRVTPTDDGKYIANDDQRYTFNGQTMTGKQWYAKAFFDELERTDEKGNQVYGSLMPLFKNSNGIVGGDAGIDPTGDYANERGKIITSYAKNAGNAADYDNYNAFSYEDFAGKYGDYYDKYFKDIKDDNGQTVGGFLDAKAREADAEREKAFYTVEDKWFDGDKGIDAFVGRYMESYPGNSPEQMFTDMLEHGVSEKTVKKAMRALANSAKENRSEDGTSGFYDIKDAYAKAKSNYDAKNKEAKVDDGHTEELDMLYGPNGYDVVDGKVIPKAVEEPDAKAKYNAADKSRKEYVKTALKEAEDDQATIDATANAIQNALSGVTTTDVDTVLDVIKSVEKQDFTNPVAVQLALTDLGFVGNLSGFADDLTDGWSQEDKNKLAFYLGGANLTGQTTEDYFYDFNRAEGDSLGDTWADTGYVQDRRKLRRADFAYNLEWAQEQIANGTPAGEVYNVLAGAGYQEEMEAYLPEEWRKAIFTDVTVPRMYEQAGGDNLAAWELMSPAERKATSEKMWNEMSAEEKAKKYQNADWWKYDPDVYRTTGQAFEQQLIAVLPEFINNIATSGVQAVDSIFAGISGRPEMWDTTQDMMKVQQGLAQFGKVYDETNGAAVADMVGTAAGEFLRMYTLGAVGSIAGEAFGATKAGTALANAAKNAGSWGVRKLADIGLSMATTLPFVVSSYAGSYAEAKAQGLSNGDAALYGATMGVIEGVTEGLNVDRVWGKAFGSDKFGKMIADGAKTVLGMSPVAAARLLSIPISGISEVTEELMSYTAETLWKQNINADSWGETPWDFKGFFKEAGLISFITGAVGAGVSSGSITMKSLLTDYALTDSDAFHQVFGQDLCTSIALAENLPKSALEAYEKGGATMLSQEAYKFNEGKIEECNDGIESAGKTRDAAKVNAKNELDSALLEIDKVRSKLLGVDVSNADSVHEFMDLCNRLGIKIDLNQPIAQQAAAALDARVKLLNDAYNTAIERADTTYENDKRQKEELRAGYEKKRQEHFVGLYLANRDGIIAEMPDELIKNVAKTYQDGGRYDPDVAAEQRAKSAQPVDVAQGNGYNNTITEEANANGRQGTEAGNEGQPGRDAGVSGQAVSVDNQVLSGEGRNGRANPRWIESVPVTEKAKANGIDPVELRTDNNDPSSFHAAIGEAKASNDHGAFVDQHDVDEYGRMRTFMSADGGVGVAVTDDGDIVSVFKNPKKNKSKKSSTSILFTALENGGKKLDNFNSNTLSQIYLQHGFVPVARIKFNDDYAPDGWNYERDGRPDILFWVHNGDDANTILDKMGTYEMPDVESLPLFEGENAYDEAKNYRDSLVDEKAGWPQQTVQTEQAATANAKKVDPNAPWTSKQTVAETRNARPFTAEDEQRVIDAAKQMHYNGKITFVDDPDAQWEGEINLETGDIVINRAKLTATDTERLAENPAMWVMEHELFHDMWNKGGETVDELRAAVREIYKKHPGIARGNADANYDRFLDKVIERRNAQGLSLSTRAQAEEEVVGDFFRNYAFRSDESIKALCEANGNIGQQILSWLRYKINDLKLRRSKDPWARDILRVERQYALALREANKRPHNKARAKDSSASENVVYNSSTTRNSSVGNITDEALRAINADYMPLAERYDAGLATEAETEELNKDVEKAASDAMKTSVVRNQDGTMQRLYHGSVEDFTVFDKNQIRAVDIDAPFNGFWFSSSEETSPAMRDANFTKAVFLNIENPAPYDVWRKVSKEVRQEWFSQSSNVPALRDGARSVNDEVRYRLQDMGYDGIHYSGAYNFDESNINEYNRTGTTTFSDASGRLYDLRRSEYGDARLYPHNSYNEIMPYDTAEDFYEDNNNEYRNEDVWVAFEPEQIKSADPVTYDDNDDIIPLSERFNQNKNDIRFSGANNITEEALNDAFIEDIDEIDRLLGWAPDATTVEAPVVFDDGIDTNGNRLSDEQKSYFADSKVRSRNGQLRPVYHYTNSHFTEFRPMDASKGSRRTHGDGYYFSTSEDEFRNMGRNKMVMYANVINPFEMELTPEQAEYVYDKYAAPFHEDKFGLYREHAIGALQSSYKVFDYLKEYAEQNGIGTSDILRDLGFDGVHDGSEWVAFDSNQLKFTDNKTPTEANDLRFSGALDIDQMLNEMNAEASDDEYMALARNAKYLSKRDMDEMGEMVDNAAKEKGYTIKAFHGTTDNFNEFSRGEQGRNHDGYLEFGAGFYFTPSEQEARQWVERGRSGQDGRKDAKVMAVYLNPNRIIGADDMVPGGSEYLQGLGLGKADANFLANRVYRFINYLIDERGFSNVEAQETMKSLGFDAIDATFGNGASGQYVVFDPEQIKSADPITYDDKGNIIPLSQRFDENSRDIRYSGGDATDDILNEFIDDDYMSLAEKYDAGVATEEETDRLRNIVAFAASQAGYKREAYHGTRSAPFTVFDRNLSGQNYGGYNAAGGGFDFTDTEGWARRWGAKANGNGAVRTVHAYLNTGKPFYSYDGAVDPSLAKYLPYTMTETEKENAMKSGAAFHKALEDNGVDFYDVMMREGYGSYSMYDGADNVAVYNPSQIKSADLVTYDDDGNIIPLSDRFRTDRTGDDAWKNSDIRYSTGQSLDELLQEYGAQPQGREPRASDVRVPNQVNDATRVSRFGRSVMESRHMTDDMRKTAKEMMVSQNWLSYTPTTNAESMAEARNFIAARQPLEAQADFHDMVMQGRFGKKTNAIGLQLLADASERGDVDSFYEIATDLQIAATEAGQSAQIFNVLKELKGVGSAYYMQRVVDRLNGKYDDLIQKGKMNRIVVSPELMNKLSQARTVDQIAEAEEAVAKEIAAQIPLTWTDRLSNWRYFSMLGNPVTHARNMFGNLLMKGMNAAKDTVATGIESAAERAGWIDAEDRAHSILTQADKATWSAFADASYNEQARNLSGGGKLGFETFVKQNMRSFDTKWVDALARFNFKLLEGEDIMFIRPAYKNALMQYMKAQGFTLNEKGQAGKVDAKGVFHEMTNAQQTAAVEWASQQAWKQTFRDASSLATMLNKLSKENAVSKLLVEGVMPFKKTPINIAKRGLEYSPAGIIMGTVQLATKVKQGKMSAATAIDNLASGITGTALMALGVFLAKAGLIRAGGEDKKKYETFLQDTGDQTYSFKFGDVSINMSSIAPATIPLFMGVALQEMTSRNDGDVDLSAITDIMAGTLNPFMEMSFMSSLNSALQNYNNSGIGGALGNTILTAAQNYGSQYLPTLGGKVAQFVDPTRRTTKSDATSPIGGNLDYYVRSLAKKVPGLEATLQPDVDIWGRTDTKDSFGDWLLDIANKFVLPTNVKVTNRDAVDNELIRVVESTGVTDFLPSDGNKYFTVKGERYNMNARQYAQYSQERGQAAYVALKELMASPAYQAASDETKADMLNKAKEAAYKQVNNLWKEKLGVFDK